MVGLRRLLYWEIGQQRLSTDRTRRVSRVVEVGGITCRPLTFASGATQYVRIIIEALMESGAVNNIIKDIALHAVECLNQEFAS